MEEVSNCWGHGSARTKGKVKSEIVQQHAGGNKRIYLFFLQMHQFTGWAAHLDIKKQMSQPQHDLAADVCLSMQRRLTGFDLSRRLFESIYNFFCYLDCPGARMKTGIAGKLPLTIFDWRIKMDIVARHINLIKILTATMEALAVMVCISQFDKELESWPSSRKEPSVKKLHFICL